MKPLLMINFKTYEAGTGENALRIAKIADEVAHEMGINMAIAVQSVDIMRISHEVDIPVFSQHMDPIGFGSHTGWVLPQGLKEAGASGTLLNHSEHQLDISEIEKCIDITNRIGLKTVACASDPKIAEALSVLGPDYIAVEPPELISGNISISEARPEIITNTINLVKDIDRSIPVLVGAGVKTRSDVSKAIELGADGVLLASGVMKAKKPRAAILELSKGLK
ncbi:MAG: triose-phosphate isomerase [Candidatus Micrarchaeota archaeon]|nr:triose-phosphate isomerase [Candidatus Micrarchaeota archaeon]